MGAVSGDLEMRRDSGSSNTPSPDQRLPTTLIIRNIPKMYSQKELALDWPNNGSYDLFYLPMCDNIAKGNKKFASINFTSAQAAVAFKERWEKQRLPRFHVRRGLTTLSISFAGVQGRDACLWELHKGQLHRTNKCQPLVFENGMQISHEEAIAR